VHTPPNRIVDVTVPYRSITTPPISNTMMAAAL